MPSYAARPLDCPPRPPSRWSARLGFGLAAALVVASAALRQAPEPAAASLAPVVLSDASDPCPCPQTDLTSRAEGVPPAGPEAGGLPATPVARHSGETATPAPARVVVTPVPPSPTPSGAAPTPTHAPAAPRLHALPLKGMGYQPTYAGADVPAKLRTARIQHDLRLMREVGIDTIHGWDPGIFDETLIAAAEANGLAVLLPFDLKPAYNYAEPSTREQLTAAVLAWVERYRDQPSVLMWAIGNEVTIEMDDAARRDFADFYVDLFQRVRVVDPTRPVILREAEDLFAPYLADAFARAGLGESHDGTIRAPEGFVYGVNFYTERVGPALTDWVQNTGFDVPLLVSEYAPAGAGYAGRPAGFARMYGEIVAAGPRVVGSSPYTWTTDGPEAVDAYFGLVDVDGRPVDGALAELSRLYGVDPPGWASVAPRSAQTATTTDLPQLIDKAVVVAGHRANDQGLVAPEVARLAREPTDTASGDGATRFRNVAQLADLARQLAALHQGNDRLFPGVRESIPLLDGMARWSAVEPSAPETARLFFSTVLRRDLASLGSLTGPRSE